MMQEEMEDVLLSENDMQQLVLPTNWPNIAELQEPYSWDCSTSISPAVNRAKEHLHLLQLSLQQWTSPSHPSTSLSSLSDRAGSGRQLSSKNKLPEEADLKVEGVGLSTADSISKTSGELPYLGASDVINEAVALLARLERDRQATLESLKEERQRVAKLSAKLDQLALARMITLPDAVQTEHEACAKDLAELKWHVTYRTRTEARLTLQTNKAELLNTQLNEEIDRLKQHIPLMQEKLQLEKQAMCGIVEAQKQTDEELKVILEKHSAVKNRSVAAHDKANRERAAMKKELDQFQGQLDSVTEQLKVAKSLNNDYVKNLNENRRKIHYYKQDLPPEITRHGNAKEKHTNQANKVAILEDKLKGAEQQRTQLEEEHQQLLEDAAKQRESMKAEEEEMNKQIAVKEKQLKEMDYRNKELAMDNESLEKKIGNLDKQHETDMKSLDRLSRDLERTKARLETGLQNLNTVQIQCEAKKRDLAKQQQKCFSEEQSIKTATERLRKTIKEEMQTKQTLHARIDKGITDTETARVAARTQHDICSNKDAEVKRALTGVQGKIDTLQTAYTDKSEVLSKMQSVLSEVQQQSHDVQEARNLSVSELSPQHSELKTELSSLSNQLSEMKEGTEMMKKGIEDMDSSSVMIDKASQTVQQEVDILQAEVDELVTQLTALQTHQHSIIQNIHTTSERDSDVNRQHKELMLERTDVLDKLCTDLAANKARNQSLASKYRQLQNQLLAEKTDLLGTYDERVKQENDVKDAKQLFAVQQRLHVALQEYYKYRGMYSVSELHRMQSDSKFNAHRVAELQQQIDRAVAKMAEFLRSQLDANSSVTSSNSVPSVSHDHVEVSVSATV